MRLHPQPFCLNLRERTNLDSKLEEVAQADEQVRHNLRCPLMLAFPYNAVAQVRLPVLQPGAYTFILRRNPGQVACHRKRVLSATGILLRRCEPRPVHILFGHGQDEHTGLQAVTTRVVFARTQCQAAWWLLLAQRRVSPHALPSAAVALRAEYSVCLGMPPGYVLGGANGLELVYHQQGVFRYELKPSERIVGARPVPRQVARIHLSPEVLNCQRR